jgi:hypothetical protein
VIAAMISQKSPRQAGLFSRLYRRFFPESVTQYSWRIRRVHDKDFRCNGTMPRAPLDEQDAVGLLIAMAEDWHHSVRPLTIEMVTTTVIKNSDYTETLTIYGPTLEDI